jgi:rubrerythrin
MAKKLDKDLMQTLRESGLRKKVARDVTESAGRANHGKQPKAVTQTVENLRAAAAELENRAASSRRSDAAKKAAETRKLEAAKRSTAARKAAKTRSKLRQLNANR